MVPPPELDGVDVLVFDLGEQSGSWAPSRRHRRSTRLVGLVPGGDVDQTAKSQCTVLVRSELTPEGFRDCLASVAAGVSAPAASLVIGTDKRGALESYDLKGKRVQRLPRPPGTVNTVDVRTGFPLGGRTVALVGTGGRAMSFFRIDPAGRQLREVGARVFPNQWAEVGFCLYHSALSGHFYAFITESDGDVNQWELFDQGGLVDARMVRGWPLGSAA